jgi:hypothetical protein
MPIGLVPAVVMGYIFQAEWVVWVLAILGVIVGLLNVTREDTEVEWALGGNQEHSDDPVGSSSNPLAKLISVKAQL